MSDQAANKRLGDIRKKIDGIDKTIQEMIVERADCSAEVARIKDTTKDAIFYRPEREAEILRKVMMRHCGHLDKSEMAKIFRAILSASLALQKTLKIAFLGPEGTFSQLAAINHFGLSVDLIPCNTLEAVFSNVNAGQAQYGIVPIENSITGLVNQTLDQFINSKLQICSEVVLSIRQHLMRHPDATPEIKKIYSFPQSFAQCEKWLGKNYPTVPQVELTSNALAAQQTQNELDSAAIGGEMCAKAYGLNIIEHGIEDNTHNKTRFLIIGNNQPKPGTHDRTSLLIHVGDAPGALENIINPLANNNLNMTMIRSRPDDEHENHYYFFLDLECHQEELDFIKAKQAIEKNVVSFKILGSYPKAIEPLI